MHTTTTLLTALTSGTLALANPAPAPHPALVTPAPAIHPVAARLAARQFRTSDSDLSKSIECGSSFASFVQDAPRETNTALASWLLTAAGGPAAELVTATVLDDSYTTLCDPSLTATLTPPASLSSAWSTYLEDASSWATSVAPAASSLAESCGGQISAFIELMIISDAESCTKAVVDLVDALNGGDATTTVSPTRSRTTAAPEESETGGAGGDGDDDDDNNDDGGDDNSGDGNGGSDDDNNNGSDEAGAAETSTSTGGVPRETGFVGVAAAAAVAVVGVVAAL